MSNEPSDGGKKEAVVKGPYDKEEAKEAREVIKKESRDSDYSSRTNNSKGSANSLKENTSSSKDEAGYRTENTKATKESPTKGGTKSRLSIKVETAKDDGQKELPKELLEAAQASNAHVPSSELQARIEAQENEIEKLRQMVQVLAGGEGQNIREAKILELFKRNRGLNLALEKERGRASRLKSELRLLKEELIRRDEEAQIGTFSEKKAEKEAKEQEWKEKFDQVNAKLMEVQATRSMLHAEVTKLQHALQHEVGEHLPISKILEEGSDWKGRSQQISILKEKIRGMKAKVQKNVVENIENTQFDAFENARRREYERMGENLLAKREELASMKQKLEGVLARRSVLENELKCAKEKISMLVGKSDNDDRLINALRLELEAHRQDQGPVQYGQKIGGPLSLDLVQRQHRLAASFNDLKRHCYQQELQIQAQSELIEYLRAITAAQHDQEVMQDEENQEPKNKLDISFVENSLDSTLLDVSKVLEVK